MPLRCLPTLPATSTVHLLHPFSASHTWLSFAFMPCERLASSTAPPPHSIIYPARTPQTAWCCMHQPWPTLIRSPSAPRVLAEGDSHSSLILILFSLPQLLRWRQRLSATYMPCTHNCHLKLCTAPAHSTAQHWCAFAASCLRAHMRLWLCIHRILLTAAVLLHMLCYACMQHAGAHSCCRPDVHES